MAGTTVNARGKAKADKGSRWGGSNRLVEHELNLYEVDATVLRDAVAHVLLEGDAFLVGLTQDQGAVALRILSEAGKDVWYPSTTEAFEDALRAIRDHNP